VSTAVFLNSFSDTVERKISGISNKVTELEILLTVLEEKLNSVPGLEVDEPTSISAPPTLAQPQQKEIVSTTTSSTSVDIQRAVQPTVSTLPAADSSLVPATVSTSPLDNPEYEPYIKMLKFGVPKIVVVNKATAAGLDGSLLEAYQP
jgi:hypothetical protein